ncbi:lumazine synthase [Coniosporium apollinis]|uniref:6,7-dimethyl-8-ribityllumazine synthase n=1 Tax=Coniosporium apollinis TaxID=61459 RepID=A0ABQ9P8Y8_9PEZI|nr:lumazine synthase [Coniosporium apollinis]
MASLKGPGAARAYDGSDLRIGIIHARWNSTLISALLDGTKKSLRAAGVRDENIVVSSVPGSWELPFGVQRMYASSQVQSAHSSTGGALLTSATDLLTSSTTDLPSNLSSSSTKPAPSSSTSASASTAPFDALIAIGVLIKGETMHFEYIADAVSQGLMRVQLDSGVPVVFGLLTVLTEEQGMARAGIEGRGHNHGEDWGSAAVELGVKRRGWGRGEWIE